MIMGYSPVNDQKKTELFNITLRVINPDIVPTQIKLKTRLDIKNTLFHYQFRWFVQIMKQGH